MSTNNPGNHARKYGYKAILAVGVLPAAAILAAPGMASASTGGGGVHQRQDADQSNSTRQDSSATARSTQINPAVNLSVLSSGDQRIWQNNTAGSSAHSSNGNRTWQHLIQTGTARDDSSRGHGSKWGHHSHRSHGSSQRGKAGQSNSTDQRSSATARSTQINPAVNLSVLSSGDQRIWQNNTAGSSAHSSNGNSTLQNLLHGGLLGK